MKALKLDRQLAGFHPQPDIHPGRFRPSPRDVSTNLSEVVETPTGFINFNVTTNVIKDSNRWKHTD